VVIWSFIAINALVFLYQLRLAPDQLGVRRGCRRPGCRQGPPTA
jgi:hypothetical protein